MPTLTIDSRFNGPPRSGHGGYVCGVVAGSADGDRTVSLRVPPPLDTPLQRIEEADGTVRLLHGDTMVGEGVPADQGFASVPRAVSPEEAEDAATRYRGFAEHPFPTCWGCGPERDDGLRLFTGRVDGGDPDAPGLVAAPWTPSIDLDRGDGTVPVEQVWAALDCPTFFGAVAGQPAVLASMAVAQQQPVPVGQPLVLVGWPSGEPDGRKHHGASAILDPDGGILAVSRTLWVTLSPDALARLLDAA